VPDMDWAWTINSDWGQLALWDLIARLGIATLLGAVIGWERERLEHAAGLRTHALVSVGSALVMVVSTFGFPLAADGTQGSLDPSRIAAQVVSGIGFLGAGVIIFRGNSVHGLTTAASLWAVSGVGLAAGGGLYGPAIVGTGFMFLVLSGLKPLERRFFARHARQHRIVLETAHGMDVLDEIQRAVRESGVQLQTLDFDLTSEDEDQVELTVSVDDDQALTALLAQLRAADGVRHLSWKHGSSALRKRVRATDSGPSRRS